MLRPFTLHRPETLDEAIHLISEFGEDATIYAGGTELLLAMRLGMLRYAHLVDVKGIRELGGIVRDEGTLRIGAAVTHRQLEESPEIRSALPALADLERSVANVRVRAAGTLGGNLAFAEPHADPPALLYALGANVLVAGSGGLRSISMADFTLGPYETALTHAEVMVAVQVPIPGPSVRAVYAKYQVLERPAVGVAVVASVDEGWFLSPPSVVVGAVDDIPRRVPSDPLAGHPASDAEAVAEVVASAGAMVEPVDDLSGSAEFKRHVTGIMVRRLLAAVMEGQAA